MITPNARFALLFPLAASLAACGGSPGPLDSLDKSPAGSEALKGAPAAHSSGYAVLANGAVTCTDGTITGDVGTFLATPTGAVTLTSCPVTGATDMGDGSAIQAYDAFLNSYAALAPQPGDVCTALTGTLAGVTLAPGVYCFDTAATLTGVLTLKGSSSGTWVFKIGSGNPPTGALTGTNFSVVMAGGAQACNVTWWVAEAATVTMTNSAFQGDILAGAGITLTGGTFDGNLWSKADVTVTGTTVTGCDGITGKNGKDKCNQGVGNGPEGCDPGDSDHHNPSNDEAGGTPGNPGR